jgi:hypothetical protein
MCFVKQHHVYTEPLLFDIEQKKKKEEKKIIDAQTEIIYKFLLYSNHLFMIGA